MQACNLSSILSVLYDKGMVSEKVKREALEEWVYDVRAYAFDIVEETEQKGNADLKQIRNKAQKIVDYITDLEEHELKEA